MIRLAVFDLDGTLADVNRPIKNNICDGLFRLQESGVSIAICTGKPAIYVCGLIRQIGLSDAIIIGENGASIYFGAETPPKKVISMPFNSQFNLIIDELEQRIRDRFPDSVWFQPNTVGLTCFFYDQKTEHDLSVFFEGITADVHSKDVIRIYRHIDSFDIAPVGIDKGLAIKHLAATEDINLMDIVAVGDGENDYTMLSVISNSIGIGLKDKTMAARNFDTIEDAMEYILNHLGVHNDN